VLPSGPVIRATDTGRRPGNGDRGRAGSVTAPRPYGTFTGVTAAADNRTFVLAAQKVAQLPLTTPPATRFFLLRIDPDGGVLAGGNR
jgi:hypothetical protein